MTDPKKEPTREKYENILLLGMLFIDRAIIDLVKPDKRSELDLHSALLHLFTGVELIIKSRLVKEHWSLVFEEVSAAKLGPYLSGDYKSVHFTDALQRLTNITGASLTERDRRTLEGLRNRRNRLVHSGEIGSEQEVKVLTARALNFVLKFIQKELHEEDNKQIRNYIAVCRVHVVLFNDYIEDRFKESSAQLQQLKNESKSIIRCFMCFKEATLIQDGILKCLCCELRTNDPWNFYNVNSETPPREFEGCYLDVAEGCCGDMIAMFTSIETEDVCAYICFYCGRREKSLSDFPEFDEQED